MNSRILRDTMAEAKRFIEKSEEALEYEKANPNALNWGCKYTGNVRRSSMDLTRALADLRRPNS